MQAGTTLWVAARDAEPLLAAACAVGLVHPDECAVSLPLAQYFRLQDALARQAGDETSRFSQRPLLPGTTEFVLSSLAPDQGAEAQLRRIAQAYNCAHGGHFNQVDRRNGRLVFRINVAGFPFALPSEAPATLAFMEGVLIFLHALIDIATDGAAQCALRRVMTRRASGEPALGLLDFWSAPIAFGQKAFGLEYEAETLDSYPRVRARQALTNAGVQEHLQRLIAQREAQPASAGMVDQVRAALESGVRDQVSAARRVGISVATMRRRLAAEGMSFRDLRQSVLTEAAREKLRIGCPPSLAAEELGFSDLRSFSRAFKAWTGVSPAAFARAAARERNCPLAVTHPVLPSDTGCF